MLEIFFKKERQLERLIYDYIENLGSIQSQFVKAMDLCLEKGVCDEFCFLIEQTHKFESKADDLRDEINELMYSRALIPESREDFMSLLESMDRIPGTLEVILNIISTQKIIIPDFIRQDIRELIRLSMESCDLMARQVDVMLRKEEGVRSLLSSIDQNESHCDHIERRIIIKIFDADIDPFLKLQLKEMALAMGEISDEADRVSKRVNIMNIKRRV